MKNLSLHVKMFLLMAVVVLLATIPLMIYNISTIGSLARLGNADEIERTLEHAVSRNRMSDASSHSEAVLALKKYRQFQSLKNAMLQQVVLVSVGYCVLISIVALCIGYFFIKRITKPLAQLTGATRKIADDDLDYRLRETSGGELGRLIQSFNTMAEKLRYAQQQKMVAERKATWQRVARTVAHEIKNPLTPIKLSTERLNQKYLDNSDDFGTVLQSTTSTILSEIDSLQKLVDTFHTYAKYPDPDFSTVSINKVVHDAVALFSSHDNNIRCELDTHEPTCRIDPSQIRQALTNVITNALDATIRVAQPDIVVRTAKLINEVAVSVSDNGCGISPHDFSKLFQPYFTTKSHGNGIGLALTERIVSLNGGSITPESEPGKGTTFTFYFPCVDTTQIIDFKRSA